MKAEVALSGALDNCGINIDEVESRRYEIVTGVAPLDRFEPLTQTSCEYLVLETLQEQNPANALSKALLKTAWANSPESTAAFLRRASEDFSGHPAIIKVDGFKEGKNAGQEQDNVGGASAGLL